MHVEVDNELPKRKVYILLTKFPGTWSRAIRCFSGSRYSHASIGLEEDLNTFYSFVYKGFIVEKVTRYLKPDREPFACQLYELEVSEEVYQRIKRIINEFIDNKEILQYTKIGTIMCLLHIPYRKRYCYFCSQFVAFILEMSEAVKLKKNSALYLPKDFKKMKDLRLHYEGNLKTMVDDFNLSYVGC